MDGETKDRPLYYSDLLLPYGGWEKRVTEVRLMESEKRWLHAWNLHDLFTSPMDDEQRRYIRYGHYQGWFDALDWVRSMTRLGKSDELWRLLEEERM